MKDYKIAHTIVLCGALSFFITPYISFKRVSKGITDVKRNIFGDSCPTSDYFDETVVRIAIFLNLLNYY